MAPAPGEPQAWNVTAIHLGHPLPDASAQPTRTTGLETGWRANPPHCPYSVLLPMGFTMPWPLPAHAVGSYPTLSPLLTTLRAASGLLSVALSLGLAGKPVSPAGCYPASCFHGARTFLFRLLSKHAAATVRPADRFGIRPPPGRVKPNRRLTKRLCQIIAPLEEDGLRSINGLA